MITVLYFTVVFYWYIYTYICIYWTRLPSASWITCIKAIDWL